MKKITWKEVDRLCTELAKKIDVELFDSIYGIPRGGMVVAVILSHKLKLPLVEDIGMKTLIVDDICETGRTLEKYKNSGYYTATLHCTTPLTVKPYYWVEIKGDEWLFYPWETEETSKMDYLENERREN